MHVDSRIRLGRLALVAALAVLASVSAFLLASRGSAPPGDILIFTEIPVEETGDPRFPERSRIVALDPNGAATVEVLTPDFVAARAPAISYDGRRMLFAARKKDSDDWHIWEMNLADRKSRRITEGVAGCSDPVYLPDDRIAFSAEANRAGEATNYALFTAGADGCCVQRITHHPEVDVGSTILRDGRILHASGKSTGRQPSLFAVRYDGTKADLIYRSPPSAAIRDRAWEAPNGSVYFVEEKEPTEGRLVAIAMKRPLGTRIELSEDATGAYRSVFPIGADTLIVSYRPTEAAPFALFYFESARRSLGRRIYGGGAYSAVEPVLAAAHSRPLGFISTVDPQQELGEFLCIDAGLSTLAPNPGTTGRSMFLRVETTDGLLGEVPLAADGSFHIMPPADTPVRLLTLDEDKRIVRGPSAWMWIRPGEQRGCVGCHENPELTPPNVIPEAVIPAPVRLDGVPVPELEFLPRDL